MQSETSFSYKIDLAAILFALFTAHDGKRRTNTFKSEKLLSCLSFDLTNPNHALFVKDRRYAVGFFLREKKKEKILSFCKFYRVFVPSHTSLYKTVLFAFLAVLFLPHMQKEDEDQ